MGVVHTSKLRIEKHEGPHRTAHLEGFADPIHFGILMTVNMEVGLCHPPVGLNLYVASGIAKMGITELTVAVMPWLLTMLAFLVLVTYWPGLSLWLPRALGAM